MQEENKFNALSEAFSHKRLSRYLITLDSDKYKSAKLYFYNAKLCARIYPWLCFLEVGLRNAIDKHYSEKFDNQDWLRDAVHENGFLDNERCITTSYNIKSSYDELNDKSIYSSGKLVAELTFGVWRYFFNKHQFKYGGHSLHKCFKNYNYPIYEGPDPLGSEKLAQKQIFSWLTNINNFRNRVAHYEPICFDKKLESVDTHYIEATLNLIEKILYFLDIDLTLLEKFDNPREVIEEINQLNEKFPEQSA